MNTNNNPAPMEDPGFRGKFREFDAIAAYHVILEKFWLIVTCAVAFLFFGLIYIVLAPRVYEATATIEVAQTDSPIINTTTQGSQPSGDDYRDLEVLKTIEMELSGRSLLVRVLKRPEFQGNPFLGDLTISPEDPSMARALEGLQKNINPKLRRSARLIDIVVDFPDATTAQLLANAIAAEYLLEMVTTRSGNSADVTQFLEKEADKMKQKLAATEMALQDYKGMVDLRARILDTEKDIDGLNKRYLPKHPKLIAAQNLLRDLKTQFVEELRKRAAATTQADSGAAGNDENPMDPDKLDREMARQESRYNVLQRDLETDRTLYQALLNKLKEASVVKSSKLVSVRVVEPAITPVSPIKPRKLPTLIVSLLSGCVAGLVLAFWINSLDSSLKTVDEAEQYLALPLLGAIPENRDQRKQKLLFEAPFGADSKIEAALRKTLPMSQEYYGRVRKWKGDAVDKLKSASIEINGKIESADGAPAPTPEAEAEPRVVNPRKKESAKAPEEERRLVLIEDPASIISESFRNMRAALKLLGMKEERQIFLFTSAVPAEGKSFTAANFAVSLAQEGAKILLIDADLRRPTAHKTFKLSSARNGVTEYITGQGTLEELAIKTEVKNLDLLLAGSMAPNPAELLAGGGFKKLLDDAAGKYDRIVVDSAPIHAVSDTLLICKMAQTVCLVVRAGSTPREASGRAARMLKNYGANLSGFIMNRVPMRPGFGYNPYYYYYQSSEKYGEAYGSAYGSSRKDS